MDFTWIEWLAAAASLGFASIIQSSLGFGFSLVSLPFLLAGGFSLPEAIGFNISASAVQRIFMLKRMHAHVPWKKITPLIGIALLTLPLGWMLLRELTMLPEERIDQTFGAILLLTILLREIIRPTPREQIAAFWGYLAAAVSGIMQGLANIGGPPIIIWIYAHDWTNERLRIVLMAYSLPLVPLQVALLIWAFGIEVTQTLLAGLLLLPVIFLGNRLGLYLGGRLPVPQLRLWVTGLLVLLGLNFMLSPFTPW